MLATRPRAPDFPGLSVATARWAVPLIGRTVVMLPLKIAVSVALAFQTAVLVVALKTRVEVVAPEVKTDVEPLMPMADVTAVAVALTT